MKKNVKALTLLSVFLLLLFLFGCTKEEQSRPMNVDIITSADGKTYTVKNGCEKVHFSVGDGKPCQVEISVKKQSGTLTLRIEKNGEEKPIYQGTDLPSSQFTVTADEAGEYTVTVEANDFIGEYRTELNTDGK